jgi:hypothetical protein
MSLNYVSGVQRELVMSAWHPGFRFTLMFDGVALTGSANSRQFGVEAVSFERILQ